MFNAESKDASVAMDVMGADDAFVEPLDPLDPAAQQKRGTEHDRRDMDRMGKLPQLRRNFKFASIFGYSVILGATWEISLAILAMSLTNGGTAGGIWMFLVVCFGMFNVVLSMAEMASMAPTSGGQYHWVSEFAPPQHQQILSYLVGWFTVIGWQAGMVSSAFLTAQQFESLMVLNLPSYTIQGWHGTLLSIAISLFSIFCNTVLIRKLPTMEGIVMVLHVFGFFAFIVVLWVMGPRSDSGVWTDFEDNGNWGNIGLSCLVGLTSPVITLIGADSACHLSEELKDAAWVLPRSMVATATINYTMGFIMTVTLMSTLGSDVPSILNTSIGQPYIQVILNATQSRVGTSIMTAVVAVMLLFCTVNGVTTASRQLFAFARDKGLPFSATLSYVKPGWDIPLNAVLATLTISVLLSLIIIGSTIAFNVIVSISLIGTTASYIIGIGCVARRRYCKEALLPSRFDLGAAGIVINTIALCFLVLAFVFAFFPQQPNPSPVAMNWSILITGFTMLVAGLYYFFRAKHTYHGPVKFVKKLS